MHSTIFANCKRSAWFFEGLSPGLNSKNFAEKKLCVARRTPRLCRRRGRCGSLGCHHDRRGGCEYHTVWRAVVWAVRLRADKKVSVNLRAELGGGRMTNMTIWSISSDRAERRRKEELLHATPMWSFIFSDHHTM